MISDIHLAITTDASGDATVTSATPVMGRVVAVEWTDGDLADGVDAVLYSIGSGRPDQTLLTLTNANDDDIYYPRVIAASPTGGDVTGEYVSPIATGYLRVVVSSGGATKSGAMRVYIER